MTSNCSDILRLKVGHILNKPVGFVSDVQIKGKEFHIASDLFADSLFGNISLTRIPLGVLVAGDVEATSSTECGRCLVNHLSTTSASISELYSEHDNEQSQFTIGDNGELDLGPLFRELLLVSEPIQALCCPECKGLCANCGADLNKSECGCYEENINESLSISF